MMYKIMEPVNGSVVIVGESFADRGGGESLLFLADVRGDDGVGVRALLKDAQPPIVEVLGEQVRSLSRVLEIGRHAAVPAARSGGRDDNGWSHRERNSRVEDAISPKPDAR